MKRSIVFLLALAGALTAQNWNVKLIKPPPQNVFFENLWKCRITNNEAEPVEVTLTGWVTESGKEVARGTSNPITIPPGGKMITSVDITGGTWDYDPKYEPFAMQRRPLPPSSYVFCIKVNRAEDKKKLAQECEDFSIESKISPPRLVTPRDGATIMEAYPTFVWTPPTPPPAGVTYRLRIAEVAKGETPEQALEAPRPLLEEEGIKSTIYSATQFLSYAEWQQVGVDEDVTGGAKADSTQFLSAMEWVCVTSDEDIIADLARQQEEMDADAAKAKADSQAVCGYAWQVTAMVDDEVIGRSEVWAFERAGTKSKYRKNHDTVEVCPCSTYIGWHTVTGLKSGKKYKTKVKQQAKVGSTTLLNLNYLECNTDSKYFTSNGYDCLKTMFEVPCNANPGDEILVKLKIHRDNLLGLEVAKTKLTVKVVDCSGCECDCIEVVPGSLVWGDNSWAGNGKAPGIYGVTTGGKIVNFLWRDASVGWETRFCSWGGGAVAGSLIAGDTKVYGVNSSGHVVAVWQDAGVLTYSSSISTTTVVPGSLVWSDNSWAGNGKAPGIYGVTTGGKIVNFIWQNNQWETRSCSWGGGAVAGSLIAGETKVYGVDPQGCVVAVWQDDEVLQYSNTIGCK